MTFRRNAAASLVVACALMNARVARADPQACSAAAEEGQKLRAAGKLRAARGKLLECAAEACPTIVRTDCAKWRAEVAETTPTIIVDARDADLHDIADVEVIVDGETVAAQLDGKAIAIDPGPHTLVFHRAGSPPIIERVLIKEGARGRTFAIKLGAAPASPADAPAASGGAVRGHTVWPWLVVGLGGAMATFGVVWALTAPSLPADCDASSRTCKPISGESAASFDDRQDRAGYAVGRPIFGYAFAATGAAVAAGGLLWHFLEPTGVAKAAALTPWASDSAAGVVTRGTF